MLQGFATGLRWFSSIHLLLYALTIPMGMAGLKCLCKAKNKSEVIKWGVLTLIFASLPGGIMMLMTNDAFFETFDHRKTILIPQKTTNFLNLLTNIFK